MLRSPQPRVDWTSLEQLGAACSWNWRPAREVKWPSGAKILEAKWRPTVFEPNETITSITFTGPTPVAERAQGMVSEKPALDGHRSEHVFYTLYFTTGLDATDVESDAFTPDWPRTCGMASMTWQGMRREGCHACRLSMPHGAWRNKTLT